VAAVFRNTKGQVFDELVPQQVSTSERFVSGLSNLICGKISKTLCRRGGEGARQARFFQANFWMTPGGGAARFTLGRGKKHLISIRERIKKLQPSTCTRRGDKRLVAVPGKLGESKIMLSGGGGARPYSRGIVGAGKLDAR